MINTSPPDNNLALSTTKSISEPTSYFTDSILITKATDIKYKRAGTIETITIL